MPLGLYLFPSESVCCCFSSLFSLLPLSFSLPVPLCKLSLSPTDLGFKAWHETWLVCSLKKNHPPAFIPLSLSLSTRISNYTHLACPSFECCANCSLPCLWCKLFFTHLHRTPKVWSVRFKLLGVCAQTVCSAASGKEEVAFCLHLFTAYASSGPAGVFIIIRLSQHCSLGSATC